ncbi:MAG: ABC transporter permease subunit, partial [Dehalococcoidales bacterium]|nr:ABC transporter permease subunit [Dehalococcoidales bacterium]
MSRKRIVNILLKEWQFLFTDINTTLLVTLLPLLIIGQLILYIWLAVNFAGESALNISIFQNALANLQRATPEVALLSGGERFQVLLLSQFSFYMLLIPVMISVSVATFSIVDEKLSGSLEALLATPVKTWELLLGKALAGAIPSLIVTWICSGIFLLVVRAMGWGYLLDMVMTPVWFISLFLFTPTVTILSFLLGVIGSSRAKDAKGAQNLVLLVVLPVLALIALQITGIIWFTAFSALILAFGIGLVNLFVLRVAVQLFQRES